MREQIEVKNKLVNLQKLIYNTASILDNCNDNKTIPHFADGLVNEIQSITEDINRLNEEVMKGNITLEMARLDINYWITDSNWGDAKKLFDTHFYPGGLTAHERLREAMKLFQESLGGLYFNLLDAPKECYERFYELCYEKSGAQQARIGFKKFKADYLLKDDLLQSYQHYLQKILYIFYERNFLRYDNCPLQNPQGYKFIFDFHLLSNDAKETSETLLFCKRVNHYLIMPDKYNVHLNKEKIGKYLFDYYVHLTDFDRYSISYFGEALDRYNQAMKEHGFIEDLDEEVETNILKQPEAMLLWKKLQKAKIVDKHLKPLPDISNTQMSIIADELCRFLKIKIEDLWGVNNMRTYYNRGLNQVNSDTFRKKVKNILTS